MCEREGGEQWPGLTIFDPGVVLNTGLGLGVLGLEVGWIRLGDCCVVLVFKIPQGPKV